MFLVVLLCLLATSYGQDVDKGMCITKPGIDYMFNDIESRKLATIDECCEACWNLWACELFTWLQPATPGQNGTCVLKHDQASEYVSRPTAISGWPAPPPGSDEPYQYEFDIYTLADSKIVIYLWGSDFDQLLKDGTIKSVTSTVTRLPSVGYLVQHGGSSALKINSTVSDSLHRLVYVSPASLPGGKTNAKTKFVVLTEVVYDNGQHDRILVDIEVHVRKIENIECESSSTIVMGEVGTLEINTDVTVVQFKNEYQNPVVFAQPLSFDDNEIALSRINKVNKTGFEISVHEEGESWTGHTEKVAYVVVEAGSWILQNGKRLEVGKVVSSDTVGRNVKQPTWTTVYFPASDLFVVQTSNDAHWVSTRQKFTTISNFLVALEEEERNEQTHGGEIIGWLAMEEGAGIWSDDTKYEVGLQPSVNHQWSTINFKNTYQKSLHLTASMQSYNVLDSAHLRYNKLQSNSVQIKIEEDNSADKEVEHEFETVGWLLTVGSGDLKAFPDDCYETPTALDVRSRAIQGEISVIQLKNKGQKSLNAFIQQLPTKGVLFQYEKDFEDVEELFKKGSKIKQSTEVKDDKGRVLYVPNGDVLTGGQASDSFSFVLENNGAKSNEAFVYVQISANQSPMPEPTPHPNPNPVPDTKPPKNDHYMAFVIAVIFLVVLAIVAGILVYFLYKKNHTGSEVLDLIRNSISGTDDVYALADEDRSRVNTSLIDELSVDSDDLDSA